MVTAGQINGKSGYGEAGRKRIKAGINAGMKVLGEKPMIFRGEKG